MRRLLPVIIAAAVGAATWLIAVPPAQAAISCTDRGSTLAAGSTLRRGDCLRSPNKRYAMVMQFDGNLVLYDSSNNRACWSTYGETGRAWAGDQAYALSTTIGTYTETSLGTRNPNSSWWHYLATYTDVAPPGSGRTYNVSLNDRGGIWVGWDGHRSC